MVESEGQRLEVVLVVELELKLELELELELVVVLRAAAMEVLKETRIKMPWRDWTQRWQQLA
jgi:hypothetical protein